MRAPGGPTTGSCMRPSRFPTSRTSVPHFDTVAVSNPPTIVHRCSGNTNVIAELMKLPIMADMLDRPDREGHTPLWMAAALCERELLPFSPFEHLTGASVRMHSGQEEAVKFFLEKKATVNNYGLIKNGELHAAALTCVFHIVALTLIHLTGARAQGRRGQLLHCRSTAGALIFDRKNNKITKLLIAAGAVVNAKNDDGASPLHYAVSQYALEPARKHTVPCSSASAAHQTTPWLGRVVTTVAPRRNAYKVVYTLVSNGADPEPVVANTSIYCGGYNALQCATVHQFDESEHAIEEGLKTFHK